MATSRDHSVPPSSAGDTIDDQAEDVKPSLADLEQADPSTPDAANASLTPSSKPSKRGKATPASKKGKSKKGAGAHIWINDGPNEGTEDEGSVASFSRGKKGDTPDLPKTVGTAVGFRRQANGTVGSVYSGSKVKHIKKEDGTPLWRKEIQYEFLRLVIEDTTPVFTRYSDEVKNCTFADIYIDCLAKSSKTSKVLKDRLQVDRQAAQNMAMICLLVNVGRMNTTLNFFPEMRAQLRTYHSIPSLQAYKSQRDYKSLQDAPRLKSILKGASEDEIQPRLMALIKQTPVPRCNAVNLIFVISQYAPKVSELHFKDKVDFFDLAMRSTISSKSRARAFLWLMWWYLESDFSRDAGLNNPFGPGEFGEDQNKDDPKAVPLFVPALEHITEEEGDIENLDTQEEKDFAEKMSAERKRLVAEHTTDPPLTMADPNNPDHKVVKRLKKGAGAYGDDDSIMLSDVDSRASPSAGARRSPGPLGLMDELVRLNPLNTIQGAQADSLEDDFEAHDPHPGRGRYKRVRGLNTPSRSKGVRKSGGEVKSLLKGSRATGTPDRFTPQPLQPGSGHVVISQFGSHKSKTEIEALQSGKAGPSDISTIPAGAAHKPRARTHYQRELEEHKQRRIEWALRRKRRKVLQKAQDIREKSRWLLRAAKRISELDPTYDSEDEGGNGTEPTFLGGLLGNRVTTSDDVADQEGASLAGSREADDWGEEAEHWLKIINRTKRRLNVWSGDNDIAAYTARLARGSGPGPALRSAHPEPAAKDRAVRDSVVGPMDFGVGTGAGAGVGVGASAAKQKQHLDAEIAEDLLAERSDDEDEEMGDDTVVEEGNRDLENEDEGGGVGVGGLDEGSDGDVEMD
jgi:hypothetical protein